MANNNELRLQKFMADNGIASRRKSEELIAQGKVKVNGHVAKLGDKVNPRKDLVTVSGKKIVPPRNKKLVYYMLNKPRGYVTTVSDELGRKTVMDLIPDIGERVYPVGRLDKDSEGLLILTNDGNFTNCMTHPSHEYGKIYRVTVRPSVDDMILKNLREGVVIDGRKTAPCEVTVITEQENRVVLEFVLYEGRNREIRKMCESQNLEVARLRRVAVGSLKLGMLGLGKYRELNEQDIKKLLRSAGHAEQR